MDDINSSLNYIDKLLQWENGTISLEGEEKTSKKRCRSSSLYIISTSLYGVAKISIPDGWKVSWRSYATRGAFLATSGWFTKELIIERPSTYTRYMFVVAKTNDTNITYTDVPELHLTYYKLDRGHAEYAKFADSKSIGESLESIYTCFSEFVNDETGVLEWQQNTIATNGTATGATNRICTSYLAVKNGFKMTLPDGLLANVYYYELTQAGTCVGRYYEKSKEKELFVYPIYPICRVVVQRNDDSDISTSVGDSIGFTRYYVDESIHKLVKTTYDNDTNFFNFLKNSATSAISPAWINGTILIATGENSDSSHYIRSKGFESYAPRSIVVIDIPEGLAGSVRVFSDNDPNTPENNYVGYFPDEAVTDRIIFTPNPNYYYRYILRTEPNNGITNQNELLDDFKIYVIPSLRGTNNAIYYDITTTTSLLGNVTIRAAKTINFTDGTPPYIDWYLLQTPNGNFYKSKDLKIKQYLFSFTPPSGNLADWSCGIDGNNNIFFIKDAAGYSGEGLDDTVRNQNPVYYLYSEGYIESHELDFGENFKPCGWLENCGWLVLPNGDICFTEYTRPSVATTNVWHVDSTDVTNPSNWTRTYTHAIVNPDDNDSLGMKHIHFVIQDFYTGILYFGTGDSYDSSYVYHSTDGGLTWTLTYGPDKKRCRLLNMVFTEDKIYFASDSYQSQYRGFFIAERDSTTGVVDIENAIEVSLAAINYQACYGCVYLKEIQLIAILDRNDSRSNKPLYLKGYDITNGQIKSIATIPLAGSDTGYTGFRGKFVNWYPDDNSILFGFNPATAGGTKDTNMFGVLGNQGGWSGNGSTRINNLRIYVYRDSEDNFSVKYDTVYC